jgi:hypothetical protein
MEWGHRFYMKSGFMATLSDEALEAGVSQVLRKPENGDCSLSIWTWGRAIAALPEHATAFPQREAAYWISAEAMWDDASADEDHKQWGRDALAALSPFLLTGRYVNDVSESGDDVVRSVYGATKYERLVRLKRAWDPDNVFSLNQNIRP